MGYDQHQQSNSTGALIGVVVVVLLIAVMGIVAAVATWFFFVQTSRVEAQRAIVTEQRAVAEAYRAEATAQIQQLSTSTPATPDPRLNYEVKLDREGTTSVDGEKIDLDELRAKLLELKGETSNAFTVHINADSECPVKHVVSVVDVCKEVGDIDFSIASSSESDSPPVESNAEN